MKTMMINKNEMMKQAEMATIFKVENVNGEKRVNNWGFFADQGDGTYAVYKPETPVCPVDEFFMSTLDDNGPGAIKIINEHEMNEFVAERVRDGIRGIPAMSVSMFTPCGWYFDTII